MAGTGGKREGAGRKPGSVGGNTKAAELLKAGFIKQYGKRKEKIWKALLDRAEQGDVPAIKEANERAMGKVKDTTELVNPAGGAIVFMPMEIANKHGLPLSSSTTANSK